MRRYTGTAPFEEIFFVEVSLGVDRHFWIRYTIANGPVHRRIAVWAILFGPEGVTAERAEHPLTDLSGPEIRTPAGGITPTQARGSTETLSWDLRLTDKGRPLQIVPSILGPILARGRTYRSEVTDLEISGTLNGDPVEGRGVLGHLFGPKSRIQHWAWIHAHLDQNVVFEALSAKIGLGPLPLPTLTSVGLWVNDQRYAFSNVRTLLRTEAFWSSDGFSFSARQDGCGLYGEARLCTPIATLEYRGTDDQPATARNGPFSFLRVYLERPGHPTLALTTHRATVEIGYRGAARSPLLRG